MKQNSSTLEQLEKRQEVLRKEMNKSRQTISYKWECLFTPPKADTKVQHWVNQAERAVAVYDGFMMMYKLGQRFNSVLKLFRQREKRK